MSTFDPFGFSDEDAIVKELIKNAPCQSSGLTECDIQHLRPDYSQCSSLSCNASSSITSCTYTGTDIFLDPVD